MADKAISDLTAAEQITNADLFLLEQAGTAKKLSGQTLIAFLVALADGHGGISGIEKTGTEGLVDSYRINLADGSTFDYTVTNGEKGDKGDNAYTWIRYASQEPAADSPSMGEIPDNWMGVYAGSLSAAPDDWTLYKWFEIKGKKGNTGDPAVLAESSVTYQVGTSAAEIPTGEWAEVIPDTPQGSYLWSKSVYTFNTGKPVTVYAVSRNGLDGLGTLRTINGLEPDKNGALNLTAGSVGALKKAGDTLEGMLNANGHRVTNLPTPSANGDAAPKSYVDTTSATATLAAADWTGDTAPFTQTITVAGLTDAKTADIYPEYSGTLEEKLAMKEACGCVSYAESAGAELTFYCLEEKPEVDISIRVDVGV